MRRFIVWNDSWRWSHSSHLLKINFFCGSQTSFMKSRRDVVQIPHVAPRSPHTDLHRCYRITWHCCGLVRAKINRVVLWFIHRWYILKVDGSHSDCAHCSPGQSAVTAAADGSLKKRDNADQLLTWLATVICCLDVASQHYGQLIISMLSRDVSTGSMPNCGCEGCR